ncbi:hypothetical protein O7634_06090 [Micromonospora sp. WMMD1120]|uniref:hypothetical protein n=1 Tax=Micromonospora sp. WMMD1120 TaxID=3016106 RepID=UPI00241597C6|nr:hypothetical protein [Micromonospora sp. WMMD1120]MDG4806322.1 hypothetical protein [Micromonospora sp. WMMD1120]
MSDVDPRLRDRFAAYRAETVTRIASPGPEQARRTLRLRRRRTAVAVAVTAVALAVAPIVAHGALRDDGSLPTPAETGAPTGTPSTTTPAPTPSSPPTPDVTTSTSPAAPDGRISRAQLLAARVDLPAWPAGSPKTCLTSDVRLQPSSRTDYVSVLTDVELRYTDLDDDGATETVALVACRFGEASAKQLVAFDRDRQGRIVTMARVVGTGEGLDDITDAAVTAEGEVRAQVADIQPCCSMRSYWAQQQWRTYRWTGDGFTQSDGPRSFGTDPRLTDLVLTGGDLVLGPADAGGKRPGTLTLTVTNRGPVDVAKVGFAELSFVGALTKADSSICRPWQEADESGTSCRTAGLRSGERRTYTFHLLVDPAELDQPSVRAVHFDDQDRHWQDLTYRDNRVDVRVVS